MRKWIAFISLAVLLLSVYFVLPTLGQEKKGTDEFYTIKQGDTLWDISAQFLKDPFLWPKLWQRNPYITNPHWIYPGKPVRISPIEIEEAKKELPEPPKGVAEVRPIEPEVREVRKVEAPPAPVMEEKPKPVEVKVAEVKRVGWPEIRSAGFLSDLEEKGIGLVLDSKEGKNLMSEGDIVYLAFKAAEPVLIGNRYTVFRASEPLTHPLTHKRIGRRYNITGNIEVIDQHGHFFTAKIIESFETIRKGDMIQPYSKAIMEGEEKKN